MLKTPITNNPLYKKAESIAIVCLLALSGCSDPNAAYVTGAVTIDSKPQTWGTVSFHPTGGGAVAYGTIRKDGTYSLKTGSNNSLVIGEYVVTVVATEKPPADLPPDATPPIGRLVTPKKYGRRTSTDLKFKVQAGTNTIDLNLKSDP